jgi:hypothetical protein
MDNGEVGRLGGQQTTKRRFKNQYYRALDAGATSKPKTQTVHYLSVECVAALSQLFRLSAATATGSRMAMEKDTIELK